LLVRSACRARKGATKGADAITPYLGRLDKDQLPAFIADAQAVIEAWQQTVDQLLAQTKKRAKVTVAAE
jgi:hypothetical protein